MNKNISAFRLGTLILGFIFLYGPILSLIVYSFNKSRLVTVWGGFSTQWYGRLFQNQQILDAAWLSLKVAAINATGAVILGTLAGTALARFGKFKGRALLSSMTTAPLVMPEVITGLSLLLLFVAMEQLFGWPEGRGFTTITIAHITLTLAYVTVIVQSRLATLDDSLEEAAMDLGARPGKVFFVITLPIIAPALISGWLLSFTISLDDLVITSFVSGPGSSTLPMVIFSKVRLGVSPDINALATIMVLLVTIGVIIAGIMMARQEKRRQRDLRLAAGVTLKCSWPRRPEGRTNDPLKAPPHRHDDLHGHDQPCARPECHQPGAGISRLRRAGEAERPGRVSRRRRSQSIRADDRRAAAARADRAQARRELRPTAGQRD
jgi:putrescine transport system permease protein